MSLYQKIINNIYNYKVIMVYDGNCFAVYAGYLCVSFAMISTERSKQDWNRRYDS